MRRIVALLLLCCPCSFAFAQNVYVEPWQTLVYDTVSVKAGQALQYNFGLTRGTRLSAQFQVSGGLNNQIKLMLLDEDNYQRYSSHQRYQFFQGTSGEVRGVGKYIFVVPQTGVYHVILDNGRAWLMPRNVTLHLYSVLPEATPESTKAQEGFEHVYAQLNKMFVFSDFQIAIRHCGVVNAFSNPNITICAELVDELSRRNLGPAILFVFCHELGHTLLREWGYPLWDNEDAADEFATVFLMMGRQQQAALQAAQWWSNGTKPTDAVAKIWMDDRHTLSPQRARNIGHWLNNQSELFPRWQKLLIPNMQTQVLQGLMKNADGFDQQAVRGELSRRGITAQN
jgi:Putative metallopeptidase